MKEFTIGPNDAGQRLDRWIAKTLPLLPAPLAQKYIRLKRVKVNGKGSKRDVRLQKGDVLQLYINDEFFEKPTRENAFLSVFKPQLDILYEDEHIILLNKRPGMVVHPDDQERVNTLITHVQAYLYQKRSGRLIGRIPLPPLCATASTATPGASSSPLRPPRPCG